MEYSSIDCRLQIWKIIKDDCRTENHSTVRNALVFTRLVDVMTYCVDYVGTLVTH